MAPPPALLALLEQPALARLLAAMNGDGVETRVIGGAVRNTLLGVAVSDVDLATTAVPDETIRRSNAAGFRHVPTGIAHGTVTVLVDRMPFEVTTLREDIETDGRHATVRFGRDFVADARRRDFTINALALTVDGALHDYCGGLADLAARRIRFIGDAATRIREDYLRILRFFRFQAQYGSGEPDLVSLSACIDLRAGLDGLSAERIRAELMKLLVAPGRDATLAILAGSGIWPHLTRGLARIGRLAMLGNRDDPILALAALELAVREDALRLQANLRLSNDEAGRLSAMAEAMEVLDGLAAVPDVKAIRAHAVHHGRAAVADAILASGSRFSPDRDALAGAARAVPASPFRGADVTAAGVPAGPRVGAVLRAAENAWIAADFPVDDARVRAILAQALGAPAN